MFRPCLSILVLLVFLMLTGGISEHIHVLLDHHDDHADTTHCQICYLLAVASVAVAVTLALPMFHDRAGSPIPIIEQRRPCVARPRDTAPRGPPIR